MTMHDADRPTAYDSVEEDDLEAGKDVDVDVADADLEEPGDDEPDADLEEPGDDEPDAAWSREEDHTVDEDTDEGEDTEPELVETGEAYEPETTPGSDPREKLAPVGPDSAMDPGTGSYQDRWGAIQAGFIDDPGRTVESASALLAEIGDDITRAITDAREGIDDRWRTTESSTDDLRAAMQDYRALYGRLTSFAPGG
jgi:hypothetical protein